MNRLIRLSYLVLLVIVASCSSDNENSTHQMNGFRVVVRLMNEPDGLHPVDHRSINTQDILHLMYQSLLAPDFENGQLCGVLSDTLPEIKQWSDSAEITYHIRKGASWDNGSPITSRDVLFTFKTCRFSAPENSDLTPVYKSILDIRTDSKDSSVVRFICRPQTRDVYYTGAVLNILQEAKFDSTHVLSKFSFKHLLNSEESDLPQAVQDYYHNFNRPDLGSKPGTFGGSGAYTLTSWEAGQDLLFKKKSTWWGDSLSTMNPYFQAFPNEIEYVIIQDENTAINALKSGYIDIMACTSTANFLALDSSLAFSNHFRKDTAKWTTLNAVAINSCRTPFQDIHVRQALSMLFNRKLYVEKIQHGLAVPIHSFLHPGISSNYQVYYPYNFNPDSAAKILDADGWTEVDKKGVRAKDINGKLVPLSIDYMYNEGNDGRKILGLQFKEDAALIGIDVKVTPVLWQSYLDRLFSGKYDMAYVSIDNGLPPFDPSDFLVSTSTYATGNVACFSDPEVDKCCREIASSVGDINTQTTWDSLQSEVQKEAPYIYLSTNMQKLVFSRRLDNAYASVVSPGYWVAGMKLKSNAEMNP